MLQPVSATSTDTDFIMLEYNSITNPSGNIYSINSIVVLQNSLIDAIGANEEIRIQFVIYGTIGSTGATGPPISVSGATGAIILSDGTGGVTPATKSFIDATTGQFNLTSKIDIQSSLSNQSISVGNSAGNTGQGLNAVAVGNSAGNTGQGLNAVAIGNSSGLNSQQNQGVAIGYVAGRNNQGTSSISIGNGAGYNTQESDSIAIGTSAGGDQQSKDCIAIGKNAGANQQSTDSIAIGSDAGRVSLQPNCIAIGNHAAQNSSVGNSITLNASNTSLDPANSGLYINPIRTTSTGINNTLVYDSNSEVMSNTVLYVDSANNRVGINKNIPRETLEINGNTIISSETTGASSSSNKLYFYGTTSLSVQNEQAYIRSSVYSLNTNGGDLEFWTSDITSTLQQRMTIDGAGRIRGDFSNAVIGSRLLFQTSDTVNGSTSISAIPNTSGIINTIAGFEAYGDSDPDNSNFISMTTDTNGFSVIGSSKLGTGTTGDLIIRVGDTGILNGNECIRVNTNYDTLFLDGANPTSTTVYAEKIQTRTTSSSGAAISLNTYDNTGVNQNTARVTMRRIYTGDINLTNTDTPNDAGVGYMDFQTYLNGNQLFRIGAINANVDNTTGGRLTLNTRAAGSIGLSTCPARLVINDSGRVGIGDFDQLSGVSYPPLYGTPLSTYTYNRENSTVIRGDIDTGSTPVGLRINRTDITTPASPVTTEIRFDIQGAIGSEIFVVRDGAENIINITPQNTGGPTLNTRNSINIDSGTITFGTTSAAGASSKQVGINVESPAAYSLDIHRYVGSSGNIILNGDSTLSGNPNITFQQTGANPHALGEIDGEQDGNDGGTLEFYTKLDGGNVTEKLRINNVGAVGIGGANFGDAGAVLTSNGATGIVSWTAPVYVTAFKTSDTNVTVPTASTFFTDVTGMTIELSTGNIYNAATGQFTAPRTAIYIIDYAVNIFEAVSNYTHFISPIVSVNRGGSGFVIEMSQNYSDISKDTQHMTIRAVYMTQLNQGDVVKNEVEFYHDNGTTATIRGDATTPRCTFQIIRSIT